MTCVVGIVDTDGKVWMGCDSVTVNDYGFAYENNYRKLGRNGDFLIGTAGSARVVQLVKHVLEPPPCDGDVYQYMARDFVNAVRECIEKAKAEEEYKNSQLLIGYKGKLFYIGSNYMVSENSAGYFAIGSAQDFAMGVLHVTSLLNDMTALRRLNLALETSDELNAYVSRPFYIESI